MTQTADGLIPDDLIGLDRFEARNRVVELLDEAGGSKRSRTASSRRLMATARAW